MLQKIKNAAFNSKIDPKIEAIIPKMPLKIRLAEIVFSKKIFFPSLENFMFRYIKKPDTYTAFCILVSGQKFLRIRVFTPSSFLLVTGPSPCAPTTVS